ncbi:RNA (guanine-9-)-methyltransferase domain-containing protein 3 [Tupaia chinensis]|uniref:tRNA methyltransferase 10 homolog B n=1 Tax=Tupaia chinensis TaxID=246437 RepID=L9L4H0_TUPCH|nr:RNA (guanine-9-)-methyltransferase domain-containing protein 3 [Tupaia chinensis]
MCAAAVWDLSASATLVRDLFSAHIFQRDLTSIAFQPSHNSVVKGQRTDHMSWMLEGSAQKAESPALQGQEGILEDTGGDGISESFQLLQIDLEGECHEGETLSTDSATWCSELSRLAGQIRRLYGSNRKADRPFWICLTGFTTDSPLYEECLRMNDGFSSYLLDVTEEDCFDVFPLETLVYLTPDSEHTLEDVDPNQVYILGGLVDESIQKKVTFQKAQEYSVKTARLPIQEYMVRHPNGKNYHSEILAINQVFDILSAYFETHNWPEALKRGVSLGKGYVLRNSVE